MRGRGSVGRLVYEEVLCEWVNCVEKSESNPQSYSARVAAAVCLLDNIYSLLATSRESRLTVQCFLSEARSLIDN